MRELAFVAVAAVVILAIFVVLWEVYEKYSLSQNGKERSFILYLLGALFCGLLGVGAIGSLAIEVACPFNSGVGCAFVVSALSFPLSLAIGFAAFLFVWVKQGHHVINSKDGSARPNPSVNTDAAR